MSDPSDWIAVTLTDEDLRQAYDRAQRRFDAVRGWKGNIENDRVGALGEMAVARYLGVELDPDWTWQADLDRKCDVGGWQVRTRTRVDGELGLNRGDDGMFILCLAHETPRIWLAGWLPSATGFALGTHREDGENTRSWWTVEQRHLYALPDRNGYQRRGTEFGCDPYLEFWCEVCNRMHPLIEHALCRARARSDRYKPAT